MYVSNTEMDDMEGWQKAAHIPILVRQIKDSRETLGGLRLLIHLQNRDAGAPPVSVAVAMALTKLAENMAEYLEPNVAAQFGTAMYTGTIRALLDASDDEIKTRPKDFFAKASSRAAAVLASLSSEVLPAWSHTNVEGLRLAIKLIKCPYLEKRLVGLSDVRRLVEMAVRSMQPVGQGWGMPMIPTVNGEDVARSLREVELVEILFGDNMHVQLLHRALDLLKFMVQFGSLTNEHLDLIWTSAKGKHESEVAEVFSIIAGLSPVLSTPQALHLYRHIEKVSFADYDDGLLTLVQQFTTGAMDGHYRRYLMSLSLQHQLQQQAAGEGQGLAAAGPGAAGMLPEEPEYFGVDLCWRLFNSPGQPVPMGMRRHALAILMDWMMYPVLYPRCHPFLEKCIENLGNKFNVPLSLRFIMCILPQFDLMPSPTDLSPEGCSGMGALLGNDILDLLNQDFIAFRAGTPMDPTDPSGSLSSLDQLLVRLKFFTFLFEHSPLLLSFDQVHLLWTQLVGTRVGQDRLFEWLGAILKLDKKAADGASTPIMTVAVAERILNELVAVRACVVVCSVV